jgi:hypothetical protein
LLAQLGKCGGFRRVAELSGDFCLQPAPFPKKGLSDPTVEGSLAGNDEDPASAVAERELRDLYSFGLDLQAE